MKKLILGLVLLAASAVASAQWIPMTDAWVRLDGGAAVSSGYLTVKDETTTLTGRGIITFLGSAITCVDNAGNLATECTVATASGYATVLEEAGALTQRASLNFIGSLMTCADNAGATRTDCTIGSAYSTVQDEGGALTQRPTIDFVGSGVVCADSGGTKTQCTISSGGAPTGVDYLVGTADGTLSAEIVVGTSPGGELGGTWAAPTIDDGVAVTNWNLTTPTITGAAVWQDGVRQTFNPDGTNSGLNVGSQAGDPGSPSNGDVWYDSTDNTLDARINGVTVNLNGSSATYPGMNHNPRTTLVEWDDFGGRQTNSGAATTIGGLHGFYAVGSGTTSGYLFSSNPTMDGTSPGVATVSTGTTTTGVGALTWGQTATSGGSIQNAGGLIYETRAWVATASGGTDIHFTAFGLMDAPVGNAGGSSNAMYIYWDNNADSHWGCHNEAAGTVTESLSTTVATAAAWHVFRVTVNAALTSVKYEVDGAELSCSPKTTNIPSGSTQLFTAANKIVAGGGSACPTAATCTMTTDYSYLYVPGLGR